MSQRAETRDDVAVVSATVNGSFANQMDLDESGQDSRPTSPVCLQEVEIDIDVGSSTKKITVSDLLCT